MNSDILKDLSGYQHFVEKKVIVQCIASPCQVKWLPHNCACRGLNARPLPHKCTHSNACR